MRIKTFARSIADHIDRQMREATELMFMGNSHATCCNPPQNPLTLAALQETVKLVEGILGEPWDSSRRPLDAFREPVPLHMPNPLGIGSIPVYTSSLLGDSVTPEPPVMKRGPYLKRRIKRWRQAHPSYIKANGTFYLVHEREVWCHPDDLGKFGRHMDRSSFHRVDKEESC